MGQAPEDSGQRERSQCDNKKKRWLLRVGQNWSGTFSLANAIFAQSKRRCQVSLKVHAFASLQVSEPIAELLDGARSRHVALAWRLLRSAAATRARSTRLVRCVKRPPRTP